MGKIYTGKIGLEDIAFGVGQLTQVLGNGKARHITKVNLQNMPFDELKTVGEALQEFNDLLVSQSYSTVNADLPKVKITAENIDSINTLAASIADVLTTANNILNVNAVATDIEAIKAAPSAATQADQAVLNAQYIRSRLSQTQSTIYDYLQWLRAYHIETVAPFQDKIDQALITLQNMIDNAVNTIVAGNEMAIKLATYDLEIQVHARCWTPRIIIDDPNHKIVWHIPESKNQCVVTPGQGGDCTCDEVTQEDVDNAFPDAPPLFITPTIDCMPVGNLHVSENNSIGAVIHTFTGDDGGYGNQAKWSTTSTAINIDQDTGVMTAAEVYDFETTNSYSITVKYGTAADNSDCSFTLTIDDVTEATVPVIEDQTMTITEGNAIDDPIGQLAVISGDENGIVWHLDSNIHAEASQSGLVTAKEVFDYDVANQFNMSITAQNAEGFSDIHTLTINVVEESEGPILGAHNFSIVEGNTVGNNIGRLNALSYGAVEDNVFYTINQNDFIDVSPDGLVTASQSFEYDDGSMYSTLATVTSNGVTSQPASVVLRVHEIACDALTTCDPHTYRIDAGLNGYLEASSVIAIVDTIINQTDFKINVVCSDIAFKTSVGSVASFNSTTGELLTNTILQARRAPYTVALTSVESSCVDWNLNMSLIVDSVENPPLLDDKNVTMAGNTSSSEIRQRIYNSDHSGYTGTNTVLELVSPIDNSHISDLGIYQGDQVKIVWTRDPDDFCGVIPVIIRVTNDTGSSLYNLNINVEKYIATESNGRVKWYADAVIGDSSITSLDEFITNDAGGDTNTFTVDGDGKFHVDPNTNKLVLDVDASTLDESIAYNYTYSNSCGSVTNTLYPEVMSVPVISSVPQSKLGNAQCPDFYSVVIGFSHDASDSVVLFEGTAPDPVRIRPDGRLCTESNIPPERDGEFIDVSVRCQTNYGKWSEFVTITYEINV